MVIELGGRVRVTLDVQQDVASNRSTVRVTRVHLRTSQGYVGSCWVTGYININGSRAATMELGNTYSCDLTYSESWAGGGEGYWSGFTNSSVTVSHLEDGTGSVTVRASLTLRQTTGSFTDGISVSASAALPQIPRVSELTAQGVPLGQEMEIQLTRAAAGFTDTVCWSCGSASGTLAEQTAQTSLSWAVPLGLAAQAPDDVQVPVTLTVTTFADGTQVGSRELSVTCTVPDTVVPTAAVTVTDRMGYEESFGGYIQSQSQARVTTQAAGVYGSTIRSIAVVCGSLSGTGAEVSFALASSGSVGISVTVTDSRGRTATAATAITVLPYQKPQVTLREAYRCDSQGTAQADGEWLRVVFDAAVTALTGNTAAYRGLCAVHGGGETRETSLTDYAGQFTVTGGSFLLSAGLDTAYDCRVEARDGFCTVESAPAPVSVAFVLLDLCRSTKAVGIGMRAKNAGKLSVGMNADMGEHRIENLLAPEQNTDAATKGYVDDCIRQLAQTLGVTF